MHKHNNLLRADIPPKGVTYSLHCFSSDIIIIAVPISSTDCFVMLNEFIVVWY